MINKERLEFYKNISSVMYELLQAAYNDKDTEQAEHRVRWALYEMEMLAKQINQDMNGYVIKSLGSL